MYSFKDISKTRIWLKANGYKQTTKIFDGSWIYNKNNSNMYMRWNPSGKFNLDGHIDLVPIKEQQYG